MPRGWDESDSNVRLKRFEAFLQTPNGKRLMQAYLDGGDSVANLVNAFKDMVEVEIALERARAQAKNADERAAAMEHEAAKEASRAARQQRQAAQAQQRRDAGQASSQERAAKAAREKAEYEERRARAARQTADEMKRQERSQEQLDKAARMAYHAEQKARSEGIEEDARIDAARKKLVAEHEHNLKMANLDREEQYKKAQDERAHRQQLANVERDAELARQRSKAEAKLFGKMKKYYVEKAKTEKVAALLAELEILSDPAKRSLMNKIRAQQLEHEKTMHEMSLAAQLARLKVWTKAIVNFTKDPKRMRNVALAIGGIILFAFVAKHATSLVAGQIRKRLNTPSLVRETSYRPLLSYLNPYYKRPEAPEMGDIVLTAEKHDLLEKLSQEVVGAVREGLPLPNIGIFGPPGTGKTMFIEVLARRSGLAYVKMTGGDVAPLLANGTAVTKWHEFYDWLEAQKKGAIVVIDEADACLPEGSAEEPRSEKMSAFVNAFLARTGKASTKVMFVTATNKPGIMAKALQNRWSETIKMGLPEEDARQKIIQKQLDRTHGATTKTGCSLSVCNDVTKEFVKSLAGQMGGLSGRDIVEKVMNRVKRQAALSRDKKVTKELMTASWEKTRQQLAALKQFCQEEG